MCVLRHILLCSAIFNLFTFLIGLFLGIFREDLIILSLSLTLVGLIGMSLFAVFWFLKPKCLDRPGAYLKRWKQDKLCTMDKINPDNTEEVMRSIRGIPFLIQAIQYSMETTYYRDLMSELGEGVVRTSVIHTAPACTSVLDSDEEEEPVVGSATPRHSAEEQWLPIGENWRNQQLRLSLKNASSNLLVFPLCEASPQRDSIDREVIEHDFSRIDSIRRNHGLQPKTAKNAFQVRCIGMSASFIEKFNSGFRASSFD